MEQERGMKRGSDEFDDFLGSGMKRKRASEFEMRLLIPSKAAGSIIGKGGSRIKQLRTDNNANVRIPDCEGPERVLEIHTEDAPSAIRVIEQALTSMSEDNDGPPEIRLLLHNSVVGAVIGRNGSRIQDIRSQSGANIRVYKTCCPQSTERCVAIEGSDQKIVTALDLVLEATKGNEIRGQDILYSPNNFDGIYAVEYGGYGGEEDITGRNRRSTSRDSFGGSMRGRSGGMGFRNMNGGNFMPPGSLAHISKGMHMGMGLQDMNRIGAMDAIGGMNPIGGMNGINEATLAALGLLKGNDALNGAGVGMGGSLGLTQDRDMYNSAFGMDTLRGMNKNSDLIGSLDMVSASVGSPLQTQETKVTIPNDMGGAIIGTGGTRIRQIRLQSQAAIKIGEPDNSTGQRIISISGDAKSIQVAQYLLQQAVKGGAIRS